MTGMKELGSLPDVRMTLHLMGLHVRSVSRGWTYPSHEHTLFEIHWVMEGEMTMVVDGKPYPQKAGDLLIIRPGMTHSCIESGPHGFTYFCVHFSMDDHAFAAELLRQREVYFPSDSALTPAIVPALASLCELSKNPASSPSSVLQRMRLHAAMFELFGALGEQLLQTRQPETGSTAGELAEQIAWHMEQAVRETLFHNDAHEERTTLHWIALSLGISPSRLNRTFRKAFGKPPRQYLTELVTEEAKRLLLQTPMPIDQIGLMLGYRTTAHFSRQFKRWVGVAPSVFRGQGRSTVETLDAVIRQ
ncbi:AraC family transcriptional regulator [Paenibacillus gansuensis]|uniref:AraC family transcriptional regulator n=1 Tax=Paenibacillus gansuensis TaxID=306542 RepID=A0ABW5P883_9BACL